MMRIRTYALLLTACIASAGTAQARELTTTEKTNVLTWLTTINNNGPSSVTTAKNSLETLFDNIDIEMASWNATFADFFNDIPGNSLKEPLAEYFQTAPLDSGEPLEHRRRFQAAVVNGAGQRLMTRITDEGGIANLGQFMNLDCALREDVLQALEVITVAGMGLDFPGGQRGPFVDLTPGSRNTIYDAWKSFVQNNETELKHSAIHTAMTGTGAQMPWVSPIRTRLLTSIRGIKPTDTTGRDFSTDFDMLPGNAQILDEFGVIMSENNDYVDDGRLDAVYDLLDSLPAGADKPINIAAKDLFGNICPVSGTSQFPPTDRNGGPGAWSSLPGTGCVMGVQYPDQDEGDTSDNSRCLKIGVNLFKHEIGQADGAQFPGNESRWPDTAENDTFCSVLAHEVSHVLKPNDATYEMRQEAALERACTNPLNNLRSRSGSFCGNDPDAPCTAACSGPGPGEFFAGMAGQFFMDTEKMLKVAHRRLHCKELDNQFHVEPMNQFMLFANAMAVSPTGPTTVPFFKQPSNTTCEMAPKYFASITRNSNGCVNSISYQAPGGPLRQFAFIISATNPTHCVITSMSPSFSSVYPAEAATCPQ